MNQQGQHKYNTSLARVNTNQRESKTDPDQIILRI